MAAGPEAYGYGTLAVAIISLAAFAGVIIVPTMKTKAYQLIMAFCIALAVSTLTGDALFHLIPHALGLHKHEEEGEHDHEDEPVNPAEFMFLWKMLVVVGALYAFFVFEWSMHHFMDSMKSTKVRPSGHGHSHGAAPGSTVLTHDLHHHGGAAEHGNIAVPRTDNGTIEIKADNGTMGKSTDELTPGKSESFFKGMNATVIMITTGDVIHNFVDGIAVGAAFAEDVAVGIGTSIAVLCHELPHEFGDFAIYLDNGMSYKAALLLNFMSACTAFIGMFIGVAVSGGSGNVTPWIFCIIAGMFVYVALVEMLPELLHQHNDKKWLAFLMMNLGLLFGFTIMVIISLYEDKIKELTKGH